MLIDALGKIFGRRAEATAGVPEKGGARPATTEGASEALRHAGMRPPAGAPRLQPVDAKALKEQRVVAGLASHQQMTDAFRVLRTNFLQRMRVTGATTAGITSTNMGEGKSVVSANLAVSLARLPQHSVLLVDADLRRPNLHRIFGIDPAPGLADILLHDAPLEACMVDPGIERLLLLPAGEALPASSEVLSSPRARILAAELRAADDDRLILYDLPPLLPSDDALVFLQNVETSLLVVEEGGTRRADLERAVVLLKDHRLIGTVLNKARSGDGRYGYY